MYAMAFRGRAIATKDAVINNFIFIILFLLLVEREKPSGTIKFDEPLVDFR